VYSTLHTFYQWHRPFIVCAVVNYPVIGIADPAPLIQTLYMDPECQARLRLDSVLTVVDCKHLPLHLSQAAVRTTPSSVAEAVSAAAGAGGVGAAGSGPGAGLKALFNIKSAGDKSGSDYADKVPEAVLQISFADRILMNKIDLVSEKELQALFRRVHSINPNAMLFACTNSCVPIHDLLNIRAFDPTLNTALLPENIVATDASESTYTDAQQPSPAFVIKVDSDGKIARETVKFDGTAVTAASQKKKKAGLKLSAAGEKVLAAQAAAKSKHAVNTVSLLCDRPLDLDLFNTWISTMLGEKGENIYRTKGILWMKGYDEQFVVHGVHMIIDGRKGPLWEEGVKRTEASENSVVGVGLADAPGACESSRTGTLAFSAPIPKQMRRPRFSRLVFIGLGLNKEELQRGFLSCVAQQK
jgi:G3E family GTPase